MTIPKLKRTPSQDYPLRTHQGMSEVRGSHWIKRGTLLEWHSSQELHHQGIRQHLPLRGTPSGRKNDELLVPSRQTASRSPIICRNPPGGTGNKIISDWGAPPPTGGGSHHKHISIECSPTHPNQPYSLIEASSGTLASVSHSRGFSHGLSTFRTPLRNPNIPSTDLSSPDGPNP